MEDRCSGLEDDVPAILGSSNSNLHMPRHMKSRSCERLTMTGVKYPLNRMNKRSFDVAFLMAPDEKMIKRQSQSADKQYEQLELIGNMINLPTHYSSENLFENDDSYSRSSQNRVIKSFEIPSEKCNRNKLLPPEKMASSLPSYVLPKRKSFQILPPDSVTSDHYSINSQKSQGILFNTQSRSKNVIENNDRSKSSTINELNQTFSEQQPDARSAFTKVGLLSTRNKNPNFDTDGSPSPRSSVSPDALSYQSSLSPPICQTLPSKGITYNPATFQSEISHPFLMSPAGQKSIFLDNFKLSQLVQQRKNSSVMSSPQMTVANFRLEVPSTNMSYSNLPYNSLSVFPPVGSGEVLTRPRFFTSGLLPPSFAALTLPAQNVCAKCNLSFRMTSDLVYHMRSHHKTESVNESTKRRREEKLRCLVCDETFRERHHLTRHMTAHQDKESDAVIEPVEIKRRGVTASAYEK